MNEPGPSKRRVARCGPAQHFSRHQAEELALSLLRHGARVGVVHWATGLKTTVLAGWYREIHGRAPPRGPMPESTGSMIRTRTEHLYASLFGVIYARQQKDSANGRVIDTRSLVRAYEIYLSMTDEPETTLTINNAWIVARDLRAGLASVAWCRACQTPYLELRESILTGCPLCALYARAVGRGQRRNGHLATTHP